MNGKADLHLHTTFSDGVYSPAEIIKKAKDTGLRIVSVTDHDSVSGIEEAIASGKENNIEVIAGMELSASFDDMEVHILGYFMDYKNKNLVASLSGFQEERLKRAKKIVGKLNQMNIPLTIDSVLDHVNGDSVGRPHIANALVDEGHAESYHEAFQRYIGDGRPAYEQKWNFSPEDTVRLIAQAGGLSFLAHPGRSVNEELIFRLIKAGLDGIEVIHPSHGHDLVYYYRGIVSEYCLLESGGSDFHGGERGDDEALGQYSIPISTVEMMRRRLFSN
ncbi:MAG: PHP domain-containing protein [Ignavibacteriales bacterium]|nr:PHP domain-containing protein [Ignavibacteriales bacterium]